MELGGGKTLSLLLLVLTLVVGNERSWSEVEKKILQKIFLGNKFEMYVRPRANATPTSGEPLQVTVSMFILGNEIDLIKQECNLQMYFRQEWNDTRLTYNDVGAVKVLSFHDSNGLWTPDLFFVTEKSGHLHTLTKPNTMVRIYPEGRVLYSQRIFIKVSCPVDLRRFPFDTQTCSLPIESYGYTSDDIILRWKPETTFGFNEMEEYEMSFSTLEEVVHLEENSYSRLELDIHYSRFIHKMLLHVYLPLSLLVVFSWLLFCLRPTCNLPRLTAAVIVTFVTLIFLHSIKDFFLFRSYLTALDFWVGVSVLMIFGAVAETVYVLDAPEVQEEKAKIKDMLAGKFVIGGSSIDKICKLTFPSVYALFNLAYFAYYLI